MHPRVLPLCVALLLPVVARCGSPASSGPMTTTPPAPPAHGIQLAPGQYTIPAGKEQYYCYTKVLSAAEAGAIIRFEAFNGSALHHMAVFNTQVSEPPGFYACDAITKQTWIPLYSGGRSTPGLTLPAGAGTYVKAGDQILMHLHLLNATTAAVTDQAAINLHYAPAGTTVTPAGIFAIGTQYIDIPPKSTGFTISKDCTMERTINTFAIFPHMHQLATKLVLNFGSSQQTAQPLYSLDWNFADQPMAPLVKVMNPGDYLRVTCTYNNDTDQTVTYGESSKNEMCYGILFYTPFMGLDGCVDINPAAP